MSADEPFRDDDTGLSLYRCPVCKERLARAQDSLNCQGCGESFRQYGKVPVLVSQANPVFGSADLSKMESSGFRKPLLHRLGSWIPSPSLDSAGQAWRQLLGRPTSQQGVRTCLIIGAGDDTSLADEMKTHFDRVIVSDVVLGPNVDVICDGMELPIRNDAVDCVLLLAVLEHVLDPAKVVSEVRRVLREGGLVVADTPFMQPVHMRQYDFTRFTDLGYRWLFRDFEEIQRGVSVGPASGLVWSVMYLFRSLGWNRGSALVLATIARLLFFWLKYLDLLIARRPAARDAAAGLYFVGKKTLAPSLSPARLLADYRGF
jgi:SAM-dependent methyltransferase